MLRPLKKYLLIGLALPFFGACATPRAVQNSLNKLTSQGQYADAVALVQSARKRSYGAKNAFLYYLDLGMLLHLDSQYSPSNLAFESAKQLAEKLFTKSLSKELSTLLVSDNLRPYYGEDFERALLHVFSALNYHLMGDATGALVEARQVDFLLTKLQTDHGHKNIYTEDAFVRYLMGLLYENQGEINDAYISYWKSLEAYGSYKKKLRCLPPAVSGPKRPARRAAIGL